MIVSGGLRASAADTSFLTKAEVRALYGDSIPFTYLSSETGNFEQSTFTIQNVNSDFRTSGGWNVSGLPNFNNWEFVYYSSPWGLNVSADNSEITVELNPQYSIIDTENFTAFVGLSSDTAVSSAAYNASVWNCRSSIAGDIYGYSPEVDSQYSVTGFTGSNRFAVDRFVICPINYASQSSGAFSSLSCKFRGCTVSRASGMNQRLYFIVGFPRVTVGASSSSGTVPTTTEAETTSSGSGGGDTYITVIVNNNNSEVVSILNDQQQQNSEYQDKMLNNDDLGTETTIASPPNSQIAAALTAESDIWDQATQLVGTSAFWLALLGWTFSKVPLFMTVAPVFIMLSVLAYVWWRK